MQGVPFFLKQWGGVRKAKNGRLLDGRTYDEYPERIVASIPDKSRCINTEANRLASSAARNAERWHNEPARGRNEF